MEATEKKYSKGANAVCTFLAFVMLVPGIMYSGYVAAYVWNNLTNIYYIPSTAFMAVVLVNFVLFSRKSTVVEEGVDRLGTIIARWLAVPAVIWVITWVILKFI